MGSETVYIFSRSSFYFIHKQPLVTSYRIVHGSYSETASVFGVGAFEAPLFSLFSFVF